MKSDFTILKVSWSTEQEGRCRSIEQIHEEYRNLIFFLQKNDLTTHTICKEETIIDNDSSLMRSDLTDLGFEVYRRAEKRWMNGLDKGKSSSDMSSFEKELNKMKE